MLILVMAFICAGLAFEFTYYVFCVPSQSQAPLRYYKFDRIVGSFLYGTTYILSILRMPLGIPSYSIKLVMFFLGKKNYRTSRNTYFREVVHILGDFINLTLYTLLIASLVGLPSRLSLGTWFYILVYAELIRLVLMRGQMTFSAIWQILPHSKFASLIQTWRTRSAPWRWLWSKLSRYRNYYSMDAISKASYILASLRARASLDVEMATRLEYIRSFRIVPHEHPLNGGQVRDIAGGEVFIHENWTNDPWLLSGMAARRAPWMYDPRYLARPFVYRSGANALVTLFVLQHARYYPPFAVFQFGDQINVARHIPFYKILRKIGHDIEPRVREDGTHKYDPFLGWLEKKLKREVTDIDQRPLWCDEEVIEDVRQRLIAGDNVRIYTIADRYSYPPKYVEEVLLDKIRAVTTGAVAREDIY